MTSNTDMTSPINDDQLSLTSTISGDEGSDEEWTAEGIIAEGKVHNETRYLVEWTGFGIGDATWEPRDHVEGVLLDQWKAQRRLQKRGKVERFDLNRWTDAWKQTLREKYRRHELRNRLRTQAGLPENEWAVDLEARIQLTADYYPREESRDDESSDDGEVPWDRLDRPSPPSPPSGPAAATPTKEMGANGLLQPPDNSLATPVKPMTAGSREKAKPTNSTASVVDKAPPPSDQQKPATSIGGLPSSMSPPASSSAMPKTTQKADSGQQPKTGLAQWLARAKPAKPKPTVTKSGVKMPTGVTAKRSTPAAQNVFIGGTVRKKRPTLYDAASDVTKEPRLLSYKHRRTLELHQRDRENIAPPQMPKTLISLDSSHKTNKTDTADTAASPGATPPPPTAHAPTPLLASAPAAEATAMDIDTEEPAPKLKKRKSVRWVEEPSYSELMQIDSEPGLFIEESHHQYSSYDGFRPPTPPRLGSSGSPPPEATQDVTKSCSFGPNTRQYDVVFKDVPQDPLPWFSHFRASDSLTFTHTCTAQDFRPQWVVNSMMRPRDFARGYITCPTENIQHMLDRLKLHALGVMGCFDGYNIVVFPTKCEEWDFEAIEGNETDDAVLKFIICAPVHQLQPDRFFAPSPQETAPTLQETLADHEDDKDKGEQSIPRALAKFLALYYSRLIPTSLQDSKEHPFFLAFPVIENDVTELSFMVQWLESSSPATCRIFKSHEPGDWANFLNYGKANKGGTIIIHEDAIWHIRVFPEMFETLRSAAFHIHVFTRGLGEYRLYPSTHEVLSKPGYLHLERVFPLHSKVFMLTPGFILSQPCQVVIFMKWFKLNYTTSDDVVRRGKLAVCADIEDWLLELVTEQIAILPQRPSEARKRDISAWERLCGDFMDLGNDSDYLVYAPTGIDGHDEQSLVNWLGYWSLEHIDEVGLCYVLGSTSHDTGLMRKTIEVFDYAPGTIGDAQRAAEVFDKGLDQSQHGTNGPAHTRDDSYNALAWSLEKYGRPEMRSMVMANKFPVAYWNHEMSVSLSAALGAGATQFNSYIDWFKFCRPFSHTHGHSYNTYGGFFYTIDGAWDPETVDLDIKRRPWLALLRPRNLHRRPFHDTELLIWDPSYRQKFEGRREIIEEELIEAQIQLMRLVSDLVSQSTWNMPLVSVRVCWRNVLRSNSSHPIDQCLDMLDGCVSDARNFIPAPEHVIADRGWIRVTPGKPSPAPLQPAGTESTQSESEEDEEMIGVADQRIIFHPPRSTKQGHAKKTSLCRNLLFKSIHEASKSKVDFAFTPTASWYGQQVSEGRDFKHMKVAPFQKVFSELDISLI